MSYTEDFRSQSSKWGWARVIFEVEGAGPSTANIANVRIFKRCVGNLAEFTIAPGGEWSGERVRWSGYVTVYCQPAELALGNRSRWSGGGNYSGWVFVKPGGAVEFAHKGQSRFLVNDGDGLKWLDFPPDAKPAEEV